MVNNLALVMYCLDCLKLNTRYAWGAIMRPLTEKYLSKLYNAHPTHYSSSRRSKLNKLVGKNYWLCDCVGLINSFIWGGLNSPNYKSGSNHGTEKMFSLAKEKGTIDTIPEVLGLGVYMKGHVGVYVGNGNVVECTLSTRFGDGVVKTPLAKRKWTHWFMIPGLTYVKVRRTDQ